MWENCFRKMLVSLLAAFLILTFYGNIVALVQGVNPSEWWDSDWRYRIPIRIEEKSGNNLTDYQVCITIDTASLISAGKMQANCSDIRFVDSANNELSYWIESGGNTNNTKIWVKIPKIPANEQITIFMYYGNSNAHSVSNMKNTFVVADDFNDGSLDTEIWTAKHFNPKDTSGTVSVNESMGVLTISVKDDDMGTCVEYGVEASINVSKFIEKFRLRTPNWGGTGSAGWYRNTKAVIMAHSGWVWLLTGENGLLGTQTNGTYIENTADCSDIFNPEEYHVYMIIFDGKKSLFYVDGQNIGNLSIYLPIPPFVNVQFNCGQWSPYYPNSILQLDWVYLAKYTSPEPIYTLGREETFNKFDIPWEGETYRVSIISNSTVEDFNFSQPEMQIRFNVSGLSGTVGYCNVSIPKSLLRGEPWTVKINGTDWSFIQSENATHSFIYFTYTHASTLQVIIQGTWAIPEFSSTMILLFLMSLTSLAIALKKKTRKITLV